MDNEVETPEDKKARLIAEARKIKAPIDVKWDVTEIEAAIAKKKEALASQSEQAKTPPPAPPPRPAPPVQEQNAQMEGDEQDDVDYEAMYHDTAKELAVERAAHAETQESLGKLAKSYNDQGAMLSAVRTDLDAANPELFDYRAKYGPLDMPNVDKQGNPVAPPASVEKKPSAKPVASSGEVKVRITKMGHDRVETGDGKTKFNWNDEPSFPRDVAEALEARGFAEIQE